MYCIRHIFRGGFIFANFASPVLFANLTTRKNIYLRPQHECDPGNATCVGTQVQYTVHMQLSE